MKKLYLLSRSDHPVGLAAAQAVHAALQWAVEVGFDRVREWMASSNTVVLLAAEQATLDAMSVRQGSVGFVDDDLGKEITALAFEPGSIKRKALADLKLLGDLSCTPKAMGGKTSSCPRSRVVRQPVSNPCRSGFDSHRGLHVSVAQQDRATAS